MKHRILVIFMSVSILALFLGGAAGLFLGVQYAWSAVQSSSWPTIDGRIISTEIDRQSNHSTRRASPSDRSSFVPEITYRYSVDGETYEGTRIAFNELHSYDTREQAQAVLDEFRSQRSLVVYYDPNDHTNAALVTGATWQTYTPLIISVAAFLLGGFTLVTIARSILRKRAK